MSKGSPIWITIIASVISCVITIITVFFMGWNIHNQILDQVDIKIQKAVAGRLEKEPATFQISEQSKAIDKLTTEIKESTLKLVSIDTKVNQIIEILQPKKLSNFGGITWTTKK